MYTIRVTWNDVNILSSKIGGEIAWVLSPNIGKYGPSAYPASALLNTADELCHQEPNCERGVGFTVRRINHNGLGTPNVRHVIAPYCSAQFKNLEGI